MNRLTESEKTFLECFEIVARRPYLGFLAGLTIIVAGLWLYSEGMKNDQSGRILLAGVFFGLGIFEIIESYLAHMLYRIFEKTRRSDV